jgi:hypothetical protein
MARHEDVGGHDAPWPFTKKWRASIIYDFRPLGDSIPTWNQVAEGESISDAPASCLEERLAVSSTHSPGADALFWLASFDGEKKVRTVP